MKMLPKQPLTSIKKDKGSPVIGQDEGDSIMLWFPTRKGGGIFFLRESNGEISELKRGN